MGLIEDSVMEAARRERVVSSVLETMIANGEVISFANVARRAGVSRAYVYRHTDIARRIREVRVPYSMTREQLRAELVRLRAQIARNAHE